MRADILISAIRKLRVIIKTTSGSGPLSFVSGLGELEVPLSIVDDVVSNRTLRSLNLQTREKSILILVSMKSMVHVVVLI